MGRCDRRGRVGLVGQVASSPNSIAITGGSDLVHRYTGATSGLWTYSVRQYIPSTVTAGASYFILLNTYNDGGPYNWSIQTIFNLATGKLYEERGTTTTNSIIRDQWVPLFVG